MKDETYLFEVGLADPSYSGPSHEVTFGTL